MPRSEPTQGNARRNTKKVIRIRNLTGFFISLIRACVTGALCNIYLMPDEDLYVMSRRNLLEFKCFINTIVDIVNIVSHILFISLLPSSLLL